MGVFPSDLPSMATPTLGGLDSITTWHVVGVIRSNSEAGISGDAWIRFSITTRPGCCNVTTAAPQGTPTFRAGVVPRGDPAQMIVAPSGSDTTFAEQRAGRTGITAGRGFGCSRVTYPVIPAI